MKTKTIASVLLALCIIGLGVNAQPVPESENPDALEAQNNPTPNLEVAEPPQPETAAPAYAPNQPNWNQEPEIIMDIPVEQEFITDTPRSIPKRPQLKNGGGQDEYFIDWSAEDLQNQAAIAQTQHRKREIDPAKRANLSELSRIFGALHALRISCEGASDQTYRARMSSMLDMEAPIADFIRDPLINAFNSGFAEGGSGQRSCPSDSEVKEAQLAKSGYRMAKIMVEYYRNN